MIRKNIHKVDREPGKAINRKKSPPEAPDKGFVAYEDNTNNVFSETDE